MVAIGLWLKLLIHITTQVYGFHFNPWRGVLDTSMTYVVTVVGDFTCLFRFTPEIKQTTKKFLEVQSSIIPLK